MTQPLSQFINRTLFYGLLIPGTLLVVGAALLWGGLRTREVAEQQESYARAAALYVSNYVTDSAQLLSFAAADRQTDREIRAELELLLDHAEVFDEIFVLDEQLQTRFAVRDAARHADFSHLVALPPTGGGFSLTAPFYSPTSRRVVVGLVVKAGRGGYVFAELNLHGLQAYVHEVVRQRPTTEVFITDRYGNLVAHPDPALVRRQLNVGTMEPVSALSSAQSTSGLERVRGELMLISGAREDRTGWRVFLSEDAVTLYAPLLLPVVLAMSAFWVLLAVTVVLIRGRFRKGIIVPLEEFAHEIHALERGVSSNSTRPRSREGFTELRDLSRAFTEMAATIRSREKALTQAADEKESMLKEIHHRLKNNLNVAASLLSLQADEIDSLDGARKALIDSRARIYSMAQVHEELYKSENLSAVDMQSYVDGVTSELATVYGGENAVELSTRVDDVTLDIQYAIPCGIILNELISNAYEHAFPDGRDGHIEVRLESPAANRYRLMVRDDGVGTPPEVGPSTTSSLGIQLVYTLAEQIGAVVTLGRERGTSFELRWSDDAENRPERAH